MTDLTDKWKKGELKAGYYYVKNEFGNIFPSDYSEEYDSINDCSVLGFWNEVSEITEVIDKVPSYDEWDKLNNACHELEKETACLTVDNVNLKKWCEEFNALDVAKENAQLKELLKECKRQFEEVELCRYDIADTDQEDWFKISTEQAGIANKMIAKIDQALGEDK